MQTLKNCSIVAHVHDEIIIEADRRMSVTAVCETDGQNAALGERAEAPGGRIRMRVLSEGLEGGAAYGHQQNITARVTMDPTVYEALSNIEKEEKAARRVYRPLVYICSPLRW